MYGTKRKILTAAREVYTKNNFVVNETVPDDKPSKVDPAGYVDPNVRIDAMVKAGIRMDEWNKAVYDYENVDEQDDGYTMDNDRYDDVNDTLLKGMHSLERYRTEVYRQYRDYLENADLEEHVQASQLAEPVIVPPAKKE
jgi:hypothetical protein